MHDLPPSLRVILIGGTSHAGKSTLAKYLASSLGWDYQSTDNLARHPGRPWKNDGTQVPIHVKEHYATLSVDDLIDDVLKHYERNVIPQVRDLVQLHRSNSAAPGLVLEGSALLPGLLAPLLSDQVAGEWLIASEQMIANRINAGSRAAQKPAHEQLLIKKFFDRSLAFDQYLRRALAEHGLISIHACEEATVEMLAKECLEGIAGRR